MARKPYKLPDGVRFLTAAELDARRAKKVDRTLASAEDKVTSDGWQLRLPKLRRARRRRRIPRGIWRGPR